MYFIRSGPASWEEDRRKRRGVERLSVPPGAPLRRGGVLLAARTQASVAVFKLGAHSATGYAPTRISLDDIPSSTDAFTAAGPGPSIAASDWLPQLAP